MLPSPRQYDKWSLPSKWSFWAALIGIPLGVISLTVGLLPLFSTDTEKTEHTRLVLQVAQELRYNHEWLSSIAVAYQAQSSTLPTGLLKTDALFTLIQREYDLVTKEAYGEEKYIYQHTLLLRDLGVALSSPQSTVELAKFNANSEYSIHDVHFLNNFMLWYLSPLIKETLEEHQLYSLGRFGLPADQFKITGVSPLQMKRFVTNGSPIVEYSHYLGLID